MQLHYLEIILITSPDIFRYFTGLDSYFWESPTRPWFLCVPKSGKPVAVITAIGATAMSRTWIEDIRTRPSPHLCDDGISLLAQTLKEFGLQIDLPMGRES